MHVTPNQAASGKAVQTALEGLTRSRTEAGAAAQRIAEGPVEAEDIVGLKIAEHAFKANAAVLGVARRMEERLLDILA